MFDRAVADNAPQNRHPTVPAEITLDDGRMLKGKFHISGQHRIYEVLNGSGLFLDFEQHTGERELIAKSTIRAIKLISIPRAPALNSPANPLDAFNPHKILGLKQGADVDMVRKAYHRLSKIYHPDRHASSGLPKEVTDYLNASSRRINAAFDAIKEQQQARERAKQPASIYATPVYTSGDRK